MRHALPLLLALTLSACAGSEPLFGETVLRADFEGEERGAVPGTLATLPPTTPHFLFPGPPDGDGLHFRANLRSSGESGLGFGSDGRLVLNSFRGNNIALRFLPVDPDPAATRFLITWRGSLWQQSSNPGDGDVTLCATFEFPVHGGPDTDPLCLRLDPQEDSELIDVQLLEYDADGRRLPAESVGTLRKSSDDAPARNSHSILIVMDTEARTYSITGGNMGDIETGTRNFRPGAVVVPGGAPKLAVTVSRPTAFRPQTILHYAFDTIEITAIR